VNGSYDSDTGAPAGESEAISNRSAVKVIEMAVLLGTRPVHDPLGETCFTRAAGTLDIHRSGPGHACVSCGATWPCAPARAAAFMLELH
jgi:hypothetical protein